ncbi:methyltransferase domain-containing protein [Streptomyces sp. NPDC048483]|uniref:methyltransferase domain-containing protein n=1 Tax=Streptomyces sp. NPDC048483 TaxID=3154927 RepID=UPI0034236945
MTHHDHPATGQDRTGHGHHPTHGQDATHPDWALLGPDLERGAEVHTPVHEQVTAWLRELLTAAGGPGPDAVRRVLDIGSGPGVATCLLARAFPAAEVVAVDPTEALLERARDRAARLGLGDRVRTHVAEVPDGLDALDGADLIWSSKALHHIGDQRGAVAALAGHLRPGGLLAIAEGGLAPRFLPRDIGIGRPGLQSRLDAAGEEWFTQMRTALPGAVDAVEDWPAFLADAGLRTPCTRSFLLDLPAPLSTAARDYVAATLTRIVEAYGDQLDADDLTTLARLTDPHDAVGLARRPDAFLLAVQTVHVARGVVGRGRGR